MADEKKERLAGPKTYAQYLKLNELLDCQIVNSELAGKPVHDEHLFIITHQAYELWFKQVLYEIDSVRKIFMKGTLDEGKTLTVINRLHRVVLILKLLGDQFQILETMTPLDFLEFRQHLSTASGFQSLQFRLLENRLGLKEEFRIKYNQQHYKKVFSDPKSVAQLDDSINSPSLFQLVEGWLERTPGLEKTQFDFWGKYRKAVYSWLEDCMHKPALAQKDAATRDSMMQEYQRQVDTFESIFDPEQHKVFLERGDRRFSHKASQGALMISLYRDEPRFHQPFHVLTLLTDIDSLMTKWRANHVTMVQRMIGIKAGTGGSSGYQYLRSTISDRYKVFLDLFNLSAFLMPREFMPPLTSTMKRTLSVLSHEHILETDGDNSENGEFSQRMESSANATQTNEDAICSGIENVKFDV